MKRGRRRMYERAEDAWAAVSLLASLYPDRDTARRDFLNLLEREFQASGMQVPDWIDELRT
jgi:hypothetical protein